MAHDPDSTPNITSRPDPCISAGLGQIHLSERLIGLLAQTVIDDENDVLAGRANVSRRCGCASSAAEGDVPAGGI